MDKHASALEQSEHLIQYTRQDLITKAKYLAEKLDHLARGLSSKEDYSVNSLGELQSAGIDLDRLCGVLAAQRTAHSILQFVLEEES